MLTPHGFPLSVNPAQEIVMPAERFDFPNAQGHKLAALLDRPDGPARAVALFAHCFTCGKHNRAARHIAEGLKLHGIAVLRFDFTGIGASEGEFANTNFSSNVDDLVAAADHLRRTLVAPAMLIGHSLGGAAVLAAAHRVPEAKAVVTIAAPFDPAHVVGLFGEKVADFGDKDEVTLAGRPFTVRRSFLDDVKQQNLGERISRLHKALLVFHSPTDDTVGIDNASQIFITAKHPKSFISLAGADHLISSAGDAAYVARVIAAWADRYLDMAVDARMTTDRPAGTVLVRETRRGKFQQEVIVGDHRLLADEPVKDGGLNSGPGPYDLLLAALGACTAMTIRLYADLKQIPLARTQVRLRHEKIYAADCADCETKEGKIDHIDRTIAFEGDLTAEQRARLLEIADKCPVHRTLKSEVDIRTVEAAAAETADRT
jgi:putative redox protein